MIDAKIKKKRTRKINDLIKSSASKNKPTCRVLELCKQYCNGDVSEEYFRKEYFTLLPDWSEHHWHFRYGQWWESLSYDEQYHLTNKHGALRDIVLALIEEKVLPDLRDISKHHDQ